MSMLKSAWPALPLTPETIVPRSSMSAEPADLLCWQKPFRKVYVLPPRCSVAVAGPQLTAALCPWILMTFGVHGSELLALMAVAALAAGAVMVAAIGSAIATPSATATDRRRANRTPRNARDRRWSTPTTPERSVLPWNSIVIRRPRFRSLPVDFRHLQHRPLTAR